jgi:hypothetical protein
VHNFAGTSFAGSGATVVIRAGAATLATLRATDAVGDRLNDLWYVADLQIDEAGDATITPIQVFRPGTAEMVL